MSTQINLEYYSIAVEKCLPSARTHASSTRHDVMDAPQRQWRVVGGLNDAMQNV